MIDGLTIAELAVRYLTIPKWKHDAPAKGENLHFVPTFDVKDQVNIAFFVPRCVLKMNSIEFGDQYLIHAIYAMERTVSDGMKLSDLALGTPRGVDNSGIAILNGVAVRAIITPIPASEDTPPDWTWTGPWYDVSQDKSDNRTLCLAIRLDVRLEKIIL